MGVALRGFFFFNMFIDTYGLPPYIKFYQKWVNKSMTLDLNIVKVSKIFNIIQHNWKLITSLQAVEYALQSSNLQGNVILFDFR